MSLDSFYKYAEEQSKRERYVPPIVPKKDEGTYASIDKKLGGILPGGIDFSSKNSNAGSRQESIDELFRSLQEDEGIYPSLDRKLGGVLPGGSPVSKDDVLSDIARSPGYLRDKIVSGATLGLSEKALNWLDRKISDLTGTTNPEGGPIYTPKTSLGTAVGGTGEMIGALAPIGGSFRLARKATGLLPEATTMAGKLGRTALTGGLAGAGYEGARSAIQGNDAVKIAEDAGRGALFFGAGGAGGDLVSAGVNKIAPNLPGLAKDFIHGASVGGLGLAATTPTLPEGQGPTLGDLGSTAGSLGAFSAIISALTRGKVRMPADDVTLGPLPSDIPKETRTSIPLLPPAAPRRTEAGIWEAPDISRPPLAINPTAAEAVRMSEAQRYGVNYPPDTRGQAQIDFNNIINQIKIPVEQKVVPPLESTRELVNYIHEGFGGQISKNEIRKMNYAELADLAEQVAREQPGLWERSVIEARKRDVDLEDLYKTINDPEYARMKDVAGLGVDTPKPPLMRTRPRSAAEYEAIKQKVVDLAQSNPARLEAIFQRYPELRGLVPDMPKPKGKVRASAADMAYRGNAGDMVGSKVSSAPGMTETFEMRIPLERARGKAMDEDIGLGTRASNKSMSEDIGLNLGRDPSTFTTTIKNPEGNPLLDNADTWSDRAKLLLKRETMIRNFEKIMGKDAPAMIKEYLDPIQNKETERIKWLNKERGEIGELGIKARSKESELTQKLGEKLITLDEVKQLSPDNWQKIKNSEEVLRAKYDRYLDITNDALTRNGYDPIPKRKDYFRHFEDVTGLFEQYGIPRSKLEDLPTDINGITADFRPGKNFFASALRRKGNQTTYDAITGIDGYIEGASRLMFHTDNIKRLRNLDKEIRGKFAGTNQLSNFAAELTEYTNILAGKKAMMDRAAEDLVGRSIYVALDWLRRRVGANMIGANISSALTQYIPLTQSLATTSKPAMAKALKETMANLVKNDGFVDRSGFLTRRIGSDPLSLNVWDKASQKASWMFRTIDRFVSELIVRGKYSEGISKGMAPEAAIKDADKWAARLMADRSLGSMPTLFSSRSLGLFTQFQLEVNNQVSFLLKDMPGNFSKIGAASAIAQLFLYGYLFNNVFEKTSGYRPALDPVGVAIKAYQDYTNDNISTYKANTNLIRSVSNQLPFAGTFTGGRIPIGSAFPNLLDVAAGKSTLSKEAQKPVYYLIPPFGGNQLRKTLQGAGAIEDEGIYSPDGTKLKYPVGTDPTNAAKGLVFGAGGFRETRDFYKDGGQSLSEKQTTDFNKLVRAGKSKEAAYERIVLTRRMDAVDRKISETVKDKSISAETRRKLIEALREKKRALLAQRRG